MFCGVCGSETKRDYENTIYPKHTLPGCFSSLHSLAVNTHNRSPNSVLRKNILILLFFTLRFVILYLVRLVGSVFTYQIIWLFFILPHQHYIESEQLTSIESMLLFNF